MFDELRRKLHFKWEYLCYRVKGYSPEAAWSMADEIAYGYDHWLENKK